MRLFILFFILSQVLISYAAATESFPEPTVAAETFELETIESDSAGDLPARYPNFLYTNPLYVFYNEKTTFGFMISPRAWVYVANNEDTNDDLPNYRGYFDLELKCGLAESLVVGTHLGWAKKGGSLQIDATYPLNLISAGISGLYLHV
jgi:hypothetical protein